MLKRAAVTLVALTLAAGLLTGASAQEPAVLRYGTSMVNMQNLDVHHTTYAQPHQAAMQTHEPLISKNPDGTLFPLLLTTMPEVSEDGLEYSFTLKEGVLFHDGSTLRSEDVAATFRKIMAPEPVSVNAGVFGPMIEGAQDYADGNAPDISGITVQDDTHFRIRLTAPNVAFLNTIATYIAVIYPHSAAQTPGWGTEVFVGTGPYKVRSFEPGVKLVLDRFLEYHGGAKKLDGIEFIHMDENTALLEFEAGSIDITGIDDSALIRSYNEDPRFAKNIVKNVNPVTVAMSFNMNMEPFNDVKVRKAVSLAINREEIADKLLGGTALPAYTFLPEGMLGYDGSSNLLTYDPAAARELLKEAGYPDGITLEAVTTDAAATKVILQYLEQAFKESGITLKIQMMDAAGFGDLRAQGQVPMFILTWASDSGDPGDMMNLYSSPFSQYISSFYMNEDFDAALAQGLSIQDFEERAAHYRAMDVKLTREDYACAPITHPISFSLVADRVKNLEMANVFRLFNATVD